jgi:hypothetical protein
MAAHPAPRDIPPPPEGTGPEGAALWRSVLAAYELEEHEAALLRQAARVADACADLQAVLDADGLFVAGKVHPASVELRQQRILLARLVAALRLPDDATEDEGTKRPQRRGGPRGAYAPRTLRPVRDAR